MSTLAINGGTPVRTKSFPRYRTIGEEEKEAALRVLDRGILSGFLGSWDAKFLGGPEVRALEVEWQAYFDVKHAISVNSATSGLYAAVGAAGIEPGDEVIVSPFTMSASATAAIIYGGVPVFADIEEKYFCLDPRSVEERITQRTKAIIVVDIFGQPYDAQAIREIALKHHLIVIEDAAQAIGATYQGKFAGTLGDLGVFSLNVHKHIQCGEGGVVVTNDDALANKIRLIRNHAEAVVGAKGESDITNMVGFNFRMTEIEAAMSRSQLHKLKTLLAQRLEHCAYLSSKLRNIPVICIPPVRPQSTHGYYVQPFLFNDDHAQGVTRDTFFNAVKAELAPTEGDEASGVSMGLGYCKPLYLQPMYQQQIAFGRGGYPFRGAHYNGKVRYEPGICPVAERMYESDLVVSELMHPSLTTSDLDDIIRAFEKVWLHRSELTQA